MTHAKQRAMVGVLILAGVIIVGFFGMRAFHAFRHIREGGFGPGRPPPPPRETDVELIRDWMTIPYISRNYQVHPKILFDTLGISPRGNDEKSLAQLNDEFFPQSPGIVLKLIKAAIQANQPPPTPTVPDTNLTPPIPTNP